MSLHWCAVSLKREIKENKEKGEKKLFTVYQLNLKIIIIFLNREKWQKRDWTGPDRPERYISTVYSFKIRTDHCTAIACRAWDYVGNG